MPAALDGGGQAQLCLAELLVRGSDGLLALLHVHHRGIDGRFHLGDARHWHPPVRTNGAILSIFLKLGRVCRAVDPPVRRCYGSLVK
ncbi:hypothetical protein GCM10023263_07650 [Phytohabitans rumicis]